MKTALRILALCMIAVLAAGVRAQTVARQDPAAIQKAVESYLATQTAGLPGKVTYAVGMVDARLALPACPALEMFLPAGAKLWGQTSIGVRCGGGAPWSIYVTAHVRVVGEYLVTARPLPHGQVLNSTDIATQSGDLTQLPSGILTDAQQAVGKTLSASLGPGQPLRQDMLRAPLVVQQGQSVKVQSSGAGFTVTTDGKALNNAQDGQVAQVRTNSGQTVSGIARAGGLVELKF